MYIIIKIKPIKVNKYLLTTTNKLFSGGIMGKWGDEILDTTYISEVESTPRGKGIIINLRDGRRLIVIKRGLSQLLNLLGLSKRDNINTITDRLLSNGDGLVLSYVVDRDKPGVLYVYRVTTVVYTPIPHRVLFQYVSDYLNRRGVRVIEEDVIRYSRRTAMVYYTHRSGLNYSRVGDALASGIYVSNSNTGMDAIHVSAYHNIVKCRNGFVDTVLSKAISVTHRGRVEDILLRVGNAIDRVLPKIQVRNMELANVINDIEGRPVTRGEVEGWLNLIRNRLPKKYRRWFNKVSREYINEFGYSEMARLQIATYFQHRIGRRNMELGLMFNRMAMEILTG